MKGQAKIHIFLIPEGLGRIREFTLPGLLGSLALVFLVFFTLALTYLLLDYPSTKGITQQLIQLESTNREQTSRLLHLADDIILIAEKLAESQGLTGHDQAIGLLKENVERAPHAEFPSSANYDPMIRRMHESLDYLHAEVNAVALLRKSEGFGFAFNKDASSELSIDERKAGQIYHQTMIKSRLRTVARELGLAPRLALSMAQVESGFNHKAVSPRGAIGVLQIMPSLASAHFEVDPEMLFDPEINIRIGLIHMKSLLERFDDNLDLSLAAYNAGVRRVISAGYSIPPITETREYVKKVKAAMNDYVAVASWEN